MVSYLLSKIPKMDGFIPTKKSPDRLNYQDFSKTYTTVYLTKGTLFSLKHITPKKINLLILVNQN